jgi:RNA recognition motif-containing protein
VYNYKRYRNPLRGDGDGSNGYGFVEMSSKDEAKKVIDEMSGKEFMGRTININPAKSKVNRRRNTRSQDFTDRRQKRR